MTIVIRRPVIPALFVLAGLIATAGCAASGASPVPPTASPAAPSALPVVTPAATPASSATVAPSLGQSGGPLAEALVAALTADPLILHVEQVASATATGAGTVDVTLSADIDGDDLAFIYHIATPQGETSQELRVIGDQAYLLDGAAWKAVPRSVVQSSIDGMMEAIRFIDDPTMLRDVGVESIDGRDLHHLTASRTIDYTPAAGGTGQYDVFDVWVEEDGTPVLVKTAFSAESNGTKATGTTDFTFSDVGGPIEIATPSVAPG